MHHGSTLISKSAILHRPFSANATEDENHPKPSADENGHIEVHLNKLECRGKVHFGNSTQIVKLVY